MKFSFPIFNRAKAAVASVAMSAIVSFNNLIHITRANSWRDQFNPLRGLTMRRVVTLLEEGERGAYADLQWTYRFIEKRDATLRGGKRSLIGGVSEKPWKIAGVPDDQLPPGATTEMRDRQIETLRASYDCLDNRREATEHIALAEFRGFAHLEKHYAKGGANDGRCVHLEPVEQWYMCRHGLNGDWTYNEGARSGVTMGLPIDPENWIIREVEDPIDEIALICFVRKSLSQKDWDGFIESFGIQSTFIIMPQNVPQGKEDEYQAIAEKIASDGRGTLPAGSDVKTVAASEKGGVPFKEHLTEQNEQITLAITSGLLTMLAQSGSGTLAGGAHSDTFERVVRALCKRISEVFQKQFDLPILQEEHADEPVLAYFEICAESETDSTAIVKDVVALEGAGYITEASQVEEQTGYRVTREPAPDPITPEPKPGEKKPAIKNRRTVDAAPVQRLSDALSVPASWTAPIAAKWQELIAKLEDPSISDADLQAFLNTAADQIPELFADMDVNALADLMEASEGGAAVEGLRQALNDKKA
ncbi:hypothetical protein BH09VER1_BH09VER1_28490 [soil metagenome]